MSDDNIVVPPPSTRHTQGSPSPTRTSTLRTAGTQEQPRARRSKEWLKDALLGLRVVEGCLTVLPVALDRGGLGGRGGRGVLVTATQRTTYGARILRAGASRRREMNADRSARHHAEVRRVGISRVDGARRHRPLRRSCTLCRQLSQEKSECNLQYFCSRLDRLKARLRLAKLNSPAMTVAQITNVKATSNGNRRRFETVIISTKGVSAAPRVSETRQSCFHQGMTASRSASSS